MWGWIHDCTNKGVTKLVMSKRPLEKEDAEYNRPESPICWSSKLFTLLPTPIIVLIIPWSKAVLTALTEAEVSEDTASVMNIIWLNSAVVRPVTTGKRLAHCWIATAALAPLPDCCTILSIELKRFSHDDCWVVNCNSVFTWLLKDTAAKFVGCACCWM